MSSPLLRHLWLGHVCSDLAELRLRVFRAARTDAGQHFGHQTCEHFHLVCASRHFSSGAWGCGPPNPSRGVGRLTRSGLLDACTSLDLVIEHPYSLLTSSWPLRSHRSACPCGSQPPRGHLHCAILSSLGLAPPIRHERHGCFASPRPCWPKRHSLRNGMRDAPHRSWRACGGHRSCPLRWYLKRNEAPHGAKLLTSCSQFWATECCAGWNWGIYSLLLLVVRNGTGIKNRHHRSAGPSRLE